MFVVAVLRVPEAFDTAVARLATRLGLTVYEARTRLSGEPPRIVSVLADGNEADTLARGLGKDGFFGICADGDSIETDDSRSMALTLAFEPEQLVATLRDGTTREVPYAEMALLLRGMRTSIATTVRSETKTRFNAGKALLTGGLLMTSKETTSSTSRTRLRQAFLYVYDRQGSPAIAIYEQRMSYGFLGPSKGPSSLANFNTLVTELRRRAPATRFDDRLTRAPTLGAPPLPPRGADPEEWKVDLAATILSLEARGAR
jgi:hypothetical protein